jgi:hypothetical protein
VSFEIPKETHEKPKALFIERYGDRYYALYDGGDLVCVTLYKKGALEVKRRLEAAYNSMENLGQVNEESDEEDYKNNLF